MGNQNSAVDDVKLKERIGIGSYGEVFKAVWKGKPVAAKRIHGILLEDANYRRNRSKVFANLEKEWVLLKKLDHPNVVKYLTVILDGPPIIITELCDCDLEKYVKNTKPRVPFLDAVNIMNDVAEGLRYLHGISPPDGPIVHRDLASKNILLTTHLQAKIADLGLAKAFPDSAMLATAGVGTPVYAAPEIYPQKLASGFCAQKAHYTEKVDIFSYGAIILEVIVGHLPGYLPHPVLEDGKVLEEYIRRSEDIEEMGPDHPMRPLVIQCLGDAPQGRPSATEIVEFLRQVRSAHAQENFETQLVQRVVHQPYDHVFKVAVLGEGGVGKTTIIKRFLNPGGYLCSGTAPVSTMQPGDYFERLQVRGKTVQLHIVDTPGEAKSPFHNIDSIIPQIYRATNGAVIVFDVTDEESYNRVPSWLGMIQARCGHRVPVILVGNKTDNHHTKWKVDSQNVERYANESGLFYIETSATGMDNIDEIFAVLVEILIQREGRRHKPGPPNRNAVGINTSGSLLKGSSPRAIGIAPITYKAVTEPRRTEGTVQLGDRPSETRGRSTRKTKKCNC